MGYGALTYVPGVIWAREQIYHLTNPGTVSARYCYSVWLRHLVASHEAGVLSGMPGRVVELGPGNSIGIGLAALLSGVKQYRGLDVIPYAQGNRNLGIFDELVELFQKRTPIPGPDEFRAVRPNLDDYSFPTHLLSEDALQAALAPERITSLREELKSLAAGRGGDNVPGGDEYQIGYVVPWNSKPWLDHLAGTVDMAFSQAVLEHVDDPDGTYEALATMLAPTGFSSHVVDYKKHRTAYHWNGHWAYTERQWKLVRGRRRFGINRAPHSAHQKGHEKAGMEILLETPWAKAGGLTRKDLAEPFRSLDDSDLSCQGSFFLARRRDSSPTENAR